MQQPLVSIICISHNHASYIRESVRSAMNQSYKNIELIIIDDGSTDTTPEVIRDLQAEYPGLHSILLDENKGNCQAFNHAFEKSTGEFIIDLAADDILMHARVEQGLASFNNRGEAYGINFTDAAYIDTSGKILRYHYRRDKNGRLIEHVPQGSIYTDLLARYFICTPTMMMRRSVIAQLGGYDAGLAYEDFDFWIRSGKITKYCYTDQVLVYKRLLKDSLSTKQYSRNSRILESTYLVCLKAEKMNESEPERQALIKRAGYEFRQALISGNYHTAILFSEILLRNLRKGIKREIVSIMRYILRRLT